MSNPKGAVTAWLERSPNFVFIIYAIIASFSVYFCMYAFRKPWSAATFESAGWDAFKYWAGVSQILGYALAKFVGIKVCSEISHAKRAVAIIGFIFIAEIALLLFAVVPANLKIAAIFLNGIPLGMIWGLVVSFLEGRRTSELLLAGLSCSFIVSSGMVKDFGRWLIMSWQVSDYWMPFVTGLFFLGPLLFFVWMLSQLPEPNPIDENERTRRAPMNAKQRWEFLKSFLPGLTMLLVAYFFLTAYRDYRDTFGIEVFVTMGYESQSGLFTRADLPVAFIVLASLGALNLIKSNKWGLIGAYIIMAGGTALLGVGTLLYDMGLITGLTWMTLTGLGSYLAYVPYGSVLFDRTIAHTRIVGTSVFAIYVADACGYTGSIATMIADYYIFQNMKHFAFFHAFTYFMCFLGTVLLLCSCAYFIHRSESIKKENPAIQDAVPAEA